MKWLLGDQVWTVSDDGDQLRPERIGVIGRVVPGGGFVDQAGKPSRFVADYAPFAFKCEADAVRFCDAREAAQRTLSWPRVSARRERPAAQA